MLLYQELNEMDEHNPKYNIKKFKTKIVLKIQKLITILLQIQYLFFLIQ